MEQFEQLEKNMLTKFYCEAISTSDEFRLEDLQALLKYSSQETIKV